jgi:hypothetical protein
MLPCEIRSGIILLLYIPIFVILIYSMSGKAHCKEPIPKNSNQIFPEKKLRCHSSNLHIHVSVSDIYIPTTDLPILLLEICVPILGIYKSLTNTRMWKLGLRPRNSQKRNNT